MIDTNEPLEVQVEQQAKIIKALVQRAARENDVGGSAYSLFQSAITLQGEVWEKTKHLEQVLDTLGQASNQLRISEFAREQTERNLADALDAMEGGFALFTEDTLEICNTQFKNMVPDLSDKVVTGLSIGDYFSALSGSRQVISSGVPADNRVRESDNQKQAKYPSVFGLKNDRWFQITRKSASASKTVLLSTEITSIVLQNRIEKDRLIDEQAVFLNAAFEHISQGVCTFSAAGSLILGNERFRKLLRLPMQLVRKGTALSQVLEFFIRHELPAETRVATQQEFLAAVDPDCDGIERKVRLFSGELLNISIHRLPDKGFIMNVMDFTAEAQMTDLLERRVRERTIELTEANNRLRRQNQEQIRIDEQLREAKERAEEAVSSKTKFFAAASHDLLQPVNAAKLLISTMSESVENKAVAETVSRLERSFKSIESLLHALLDISRLDSTGTELTLSTFNVGEILASVQIDCMQLADEKDLRLDIVPCSLWVRSDQRYLLRSVQNLIVNAIQYTENGRILAGCRRKGSNVVLEVWDTGIGISKKDQKRIFDEFTRATPDNVGFGMGLGLSIVDRACRRLGHSVTVRSKPGVGSVFSITVPCSQPPVEIENMERSVFSKPSSDMDVIVLIVENNPDVLFATARKIEAWGGSVLTAASTAEALDQVRELGMAPDIILADYQLDGGDNGVKTIVNLRRETKSDIPAIMITANREDSLVNESLKHHFTILTKPVQLSRLRPLIDWKTRRCGAGKGDATDRFETIETAKNADKSLC
ncbi:hybrid sensor histidine kinase/response regulator [Roseibium marinum]|uniref:histidine kinase n=1 Tax=Roseibium marinum TaxID=281252 RepID=A0A2S3UL91_9HYPH|nr:ATP-binding protein [Roseibium marinum]POF28323.1 signal transduction histidine kinase [Roseibium marinum]